MKKKITLLIMCLMTMLIALPAIVYGTEESLIEAEFSTDKEEYSGSEEIIGKLSIKNTSDKKIGRLLVSTVYSENIIFMNTDVVSDYFTLEASEDLEIDLIYRKMEDIEMEVPMGSGDSNSESNMGDEAVQAGDSKSSIFWMAVLAMAFCMMVTYTIKTKGNKKGILSLFLCVVFVVGIAMPFTAQNVYADNIITYETELSTTICVDGVEEEIKVNIVYAYEDELIDSDNDGITDYEEKIIGTNPEKIDTDDDGLDDYEEVAVIGTNPNLKDSDGNGIEDQDEDADKDGLSNIQECLSGTLNYCVDTDGDLISDYDEICLYHTNPLEVDTDGDGAGDKWEIDNGFDPLKYNDTFSIKNITEGYNTSIDIDLVAKGEYIESFSCVVFEEGPYTFNKSSAGYMGNAFDFTLDGEFESAKIKYYFDEEYLKDTNLKPTVFYLNETEKCLEEIETYWDGKSNYVTAELEHFSTYILLNKTDVEKVWNADIKGPDDAVENKNLNVAFVVDVSGSMRGTPIKTAKQVVLDFLGVMDEDDLATIVGFSDKVYSSNCFEANDRLKLKANLNAFNATGGTAIYKGLNKALDLFNTTEMDGDKIIILISDGQDSSSVSYSTYSQIIENAKNENITIYTIGTSSADENLLTKIAEGTEGKYYYANYAKELADKMESIKKETVDYYADSNNDGISDYYTRLICDGTLTHFTLGHLAGWIGKYDEVQANDDFDGDGVKNGDEIKFVRIRVVYDETYFEYISDPCSPNTDDDAYSDYEEHQKGSDPMKYSLEKGEVDKLFNNDIYLASLFSNAYIDGTLLKTGVGLSNILLKTKISYETDYKKAMLEYIRIYNNETYQTKMIQTMENVYDEVIDEWIYDIEEMLSIGKDLVERNDEYGDLVEELNKSKVALEGAKELKLRKIKNLEEFEGFDKYLNDEYIKMCEEVKKYTKQGDAINSKMIDNMFINKTYTESLAKAMNKIPPSVKKVLDGTCKAVGYIGDFLFILEAGYSIYEVVELSSSFKIGLYDLVEMEEFIKWLVVYGGTNELTCAAYDVCYAIESDIGNTISTQKMIEHQFNEIAGQVLIDGILGACGFVGFAIGATGALADLAFGTGDMNETLLAVICYGDLAKANSMDLKNTMEVDKAGYYSAWEEGQVTRMQMLAQLRIVGEDKYVEAGDDRGPIGKAIASFVGQSQSDLRELCMSNMDYANNVAIKLGLHVEKKFNGSHCYEEK